MEWRTPWENVSMRAWQARPHPNDLRLLKSSPSRVQKELLLYLRLSSARARNSPHGSHHGRQI
eukprot:scaffold136057_cov19-Tisochrysis_lutea.AAC.3